VLRKKEDTNQMLTKFFENSPLGMGNMHLSMHELINFVAVVEAVDDWTDFRYVLCNKGHSHFVSEKGDIVGRKLKELKDMDLKAADAFIDVCRGKPALCTCKKFI
jgi:hypothetical protein